MYDEAESFGKYSSAKIHEAQDNQLRLFRDTRRGGHPSRINPDGSGTEHTVEYVNSLLQHRKNGEQALNIRGEVRQKLMKVPLNQLEEIAQIIADPGEMDDEHRETLLLELSQIS